MCYVTIVLQEPEETIPMRVRGRASDPGRVESDLAYRLRCEAARRRTTIVGLISELVEPRLTELERECLSRLRTTERTTRAGQAE
jgi:hypothetical protein